MEKFVIQDVFPLCVKQFPAAMSKKLVIGKLISGMLHYEILKFIRQLDLNTKLDVNFNEL